MRRGTGLAAGCGSSQTQTGPAARRRRPCSPGGGRSWPASGAGTGAAAPRRARQQRRLVPGAESWLSHGSGSENLEPRARPEAALDSGPALCPAVTRSSISRALSSAGGPRASERAAGLGSPSPEQSFRAAGALRLGKGNFHRARSSAPRSAEPRVFGSSCVSSAFSGPQLPSSLQRTKPSEGGGGGAYTGPSSWQSGSAFLVLGLRAANLPISLAAVDGAQRDPAAVAAAAASSITQRMPGRALPAVPAASQPSTGPEESGTHGSQQRSPRPQRTLAAPRSAPRLWPTRYRGRGSPRRLYYHRRRRAKAEPGRMLIPDSPYAEPL